MNTFQLVSLVIFLVAVFGYVNYRFIRLPDAIGITAVATVASLISLGAQQLYPGLTDGLGDAMARIRFPELLLHGLLGVLLFAGSMHIRMGAILAEKWQVIPLATIGVVLSTMLVGAGFWLLCRAAGVSLPPVWCLVFGALISPTDPVAVVAILKRAGVPESLETRISGESLFNDGTGVVVFITLLGVASSPDSFDLGHTLLLFLREVLGGLAFGLGAGYAGFLLLRAVDSYAVEIMITLALATAGYAAAEALSVSAPIAVACMGLLVGNRAKEEAMSDKTRERLFGFWSVLDELLNLLLFGLIGLEMLLLPLSHPGIAAGAVAVVLAARFLSIVAPILGTPRLREVARVTLPVMTWGGLRGGISIALALSLPAFDGRDILLSATYAAVIFSILIQAPTLGWLAKRRLDRQRKFEAHGS
ncbi:cation:proton antiporter [Noviherbaspirillum pedocola]|uniref:Cation:proton antiporter n=1 Tax=Noviherbaspirillum pedocola TaxID=2801341 RepID=A0A934W3R6_9BURK|nr:cation:proton antiporter [Noviherbaspirillum pedocola]MBK4737726.1 cation:proton antiporter [Noviherbaspirillum pedocola]